MSKGGMVLPAIATFFCALLATDENWQLRFRSLNQQSDIDLRVQVSLTAGFVCMCAVT